MQEGHAGWHVVSQAGIAGHQHEGHGGPALGNDLGQLDAIDHPRHSYVRHHYVHLLPVQFQKLQGGIGGPEGFHLKAFLLEHLAYQGLQQQFVF